MPNPAFIFTSDLHIGPSAWRYPQGITGDAYHAFKQVVQWCLSYPATALVIGGDLFDSQEPTPEDEQVVRFEIQRLADAGREVLFIRGNHDRGADLSRLEALHDMPFHMCHIPIEIAGLHIFGFDWVPGPQIRRHIEDQLTAADYHRVPIDFLVMHQSWAELSKGGRAEGKLADLPGDFDLLTGDLHKHLVKKFGTNMDRRAFSPGSTHLLSIDEPAKKKIFLFYDDKSYEALPLETRLKLVVDLTKDDAVPFDEFLQRDLDALLDTATQSYLNQVHLPGELQTPLLWITYPVEIPSAEKRITAVVGDRAFLFFRPVQAGTIRQASTTGRRLFAVDIPAALQQLDYTFLNDPLYTGLTPEQVQRDVLQLQLDPAPASTAVAHWLATSAQETSACATTPSASTTSANTAT